MTNTWSWVALSVSSFGMMNSHAVTVGTSLIILTIKMYVTVAYERYGVIAIS